jgi:hypothetical protein
MAAAQNRYYERHRDKRLEQMRDYARNKGMELRAQAEANPVVAEELREMMTEKYRRWIANKTDSQIKKWLEEASYTDAFKEFVKVCVVPFKDRVSRKFLNGLEALADAGRKPEVDSITHIVEDEGDYTDCEYYAYS